MSKIYKFYGTWCAPCKVLTTTLAGMANIFDGTEIEEVDIDTNPELVRQYMIKAVPTMVHVRNGSEVGRLVGLKPTDEITKWYQATSQNS